MCWRMVARPTGPTARLAKLSGTTPSTCMITGIKKAASCSLLRPNRTPSVLLNSVHCETDAAWWVHTVCTVSMIHSIEARTHTWHHIFGRSHTAWECCWCRPSLQHFAVAVQHLARCPASHRPSPLRGRPPTPGRKSQHTSLPCAASPLIPSPGLSYASLHKTHPGTFLTRLAATTGAHDYIPARGQLQQRSMGSAAPTVPSMVPRAALPKVPSLLFEMEVSSPPWISRGRAPCPLPAGVLCLAGLQQERGCSG